MPSYKPFWSHLEQLLLAAFSVTGKSNYIRLWNTWVGAESPELFFTTRVKKAMNKYRFCFKKTNEFMIFGTLLTEYSSCRSRFWLVLLLPFVHLISTRGINISSYEFEHQAGISRVYCINNVDIIYSFTTGNPCNEPEKPFPCKTSSTCIPMSYVCDDNEDCEDGYDEDIALCTAGQYSFSLQ